MKNVKIKITAQYKENYSDDLNSAPHWKSKGIALFEFMTDDGTAMYGMERLILVAKQVLKNYSNARSNYELVAIEPEFVETINIQKSVDSYMTRLSGVDAENVDTVLEHCNYLIE